jgi:hypothetical protein
LQIFGENETSPTLQAQQNKVGFLKVWACKPLEQTNQVKLRGPSKIKLDLWKFWLANPWRKRKKTTTLQNWQNKVGLLEVFPYKSLEKAKQVQLYRPSRITLDLCVFLIANYDRKTN